MTPPETVATKPPPLSRALILSALLVAIDAFLLNQGGIALIVAAWLLLIYLPRTFLAKTLRPLRAPRLRNMAIYMIAAGLVLVLNAVNNRIAQERAEGLVSAVKAFHADHRRYPESLQALVPRYIERIPSAKYTFGYNRFHYFTSDRGTTLSYTVLPPIDHRIYSFERDAWGYLN